MLVGVNAGELAEWCGLPRIPGGFVVGRGDHADPTPWPDPHDRGGVSQKRLAVVRRCGLARCWLIRGALIRGALIRVALILSALVRRLLAVVPDVLQALAKSLRNLSLGVRLLVLNGDVGGWAALVPTSGSQVLTDENSTEQAEAQDPDASDGSQYPAGFARWPWRGNCWCWLGDHSCRCRIRSRRSGRGLVGSWFVRHDVYLSARNLTLRVRAQSTLRGATMTMPCQTYESAENFVFG
jgi:hypothetical protein